jgi:DNA-binding MarR family transcriptional regulator
VSRFSDKPSRLVALTSYLLSQTAKLAKDELDACLAERGMRLRHMAVLCVLDDDPTTQLDLGRRLDLDPSDVTATVDDLEDRHLVRRSSDVSDRRRKLVTLTPRGQREVELLDQLAGRVADELFAPLSASRRAGMHEDLLTLLTARDRAVSEVPHDQRPE